MKDKTVHKTLFVISVLLFFYTLTRACLLSITWDEACSYIEFISKGIVFQENYRLISANNHLLNTVVDIIFVKCFGVKEVVLRLPSLFAHIIFLYYSAKILLSFKNKWFVFASFLIVNLNPYLLDFFSLARGYGLSLGLMMGSIYYLFVFLSKENENKHSQYAIVLAALGVLANFVLLNYFIVLFAIIVSMIVQKACKKRATEGFSIFYNLKNILFHSVIFVLLLCLVVPIVFKLKVAEALFYGGYISFWTDTISETTFTLLYESSSSILLQQIVKGFIFIVLSGSCVFLFLKRSKKQSDKNFVFLGLLMVMIVFCSLSSIVQHYWFRTPYLTNRTALFLFVLFCLIVVFFVNELCLINTKASLIVYSVALVFLILFAVSFNLKYVLEWKHDAETEEMLTDLERIKQNEFPTQNTKIGASFWLSESIDFYIGLKKLDWLEVTPIEDTTKRRIAYLYVTKSEFSYINNSGIMVIKKYPITNNLLLQLKK
jgi:hypothetical protein